MGHLYFDSVEAFQTAFGSHAGEIMGDIPNYSNVQPTIQRVLQPSSLPSRKALTYGNARTSYRFQQSLLSLSSNAVHLVMGLEYLDRFPFLPYTTTQANKRLKQSRATFHSVCLIATVTSDSMPNDKPSKPSRRAVTSQVTTPKSGHSQPLSSQTTDVIGRRVRI